MFGRIKRFQQLWTHLGPDWLIFRLSYAIRLRSGRIRRQSPPYAWEALPLSSAVGAADLADPETYLRHRLALAPAFFFAPAQRHTYAPLLSAWDAQETTPQRLGAEIRAGVLRYFEHTPAQVGMPPDWHVNPFSGQRIPADQHWSQISDFGYGDIKIIWEPSRFGFVYALVRAYWRTGDEQYADLFWTLAEHWQTHNPPNQGPNWKCGQEAAFRVMAWCFGLYGFLDAAATTADRVANMARMMAASGRRIASNIDYALSQRNNHGISEGVGLWTIGLLFPELRDASAWRERGRQVLEAQGRALIYDDGSFAQHSTNYHRLMLQDYIWALRLGDIVGEPLSAELKQRVQRAGEWLFQIQDGICGHLPNYGQNDGALVLPLNNCQPQDFRPVVQAACYLSSGTRRFDAGPWDEDLLWLFGASALESPAANLPYVDLRANAGGYSTLRSAQGFVFIHCGRFCDRPGHADLLHLDLWWRGQNIALDAGTYSYNAPAPWNNPLTQTMYHNTVSVDAQSQMDKFSKFLWLPWARCEVRRDVRSAKGLLAYWEGSHNGYQRLAEPVAHCRGVVRLADDWWLVLDRLASSGSHTYRLHWLLPDIPYEWDERDRRLIMQTPAGSYEIKVGMFSDSGSVSLVSADAHTPRGWRAPTYMVREPALSVALECQSTQQVFWSLLGPGKSQVRSEGEALFIEAMDWAATVQLVIDKEEQPLVAAVELSGALDDQLRL